MILNIFTLVWSILLEYLLSITCMLAASVSFKHIFLENYCMLKYSISILLSSGYSIGF